MLYQLEQGIESEIGDGTDPYCRRLQNSVLPVVLGTKIVMSLSLLERLVINVENMPDNTAHKSHILKDKLINLGYNKNWYGWCELDGFLALRHCFAHEFGQVTDRQKKPVEEFYRKLNNGEVLDDKGKSIEPYFELNANEILLNKHASMRLAKLSNDILNFLVSKGLTIERSPY
jgi:hypothetical protein